MAKSETRVQNVHAHEKAGAVRRHVRGKARPAAGLRAKPPAEETARERRDGLPDVAGAAVIERDVKLSEFGPLLSIDSLGKVRRAKGWRQASIGGVPSQVALVLPAGWARPAWCDRVTGSLFDTETGVCYSGRPLLERVA